MSGAAIGIVLIRHGPTPWNAAGRLQGATDIGLDAQGRAEVARWRLPADAHALGWHASPLARAVETAALLGIADPRLDQRLGEMGWGAWEGRRLADLRAAHGASLIADEARGFDFRPPGGESPREVLARFGAWLEERRREGRSVGAITHRGLIRAAIARAVGWDLVGKPPFKLLGATAHILRAEPGGVLSVVSLNVPLDGAPWPWAQS